MGKLPEKEFKIMIVMMIQNLKNRMEKMQESINKNLEEIKYKHRQTQDRQTTQLLKLKIFQKESTADYLRQKNG